MDDDAIQRKFRTVTLKTFTPSHSVRSFSHLVDCCCSRRYVHAPLFLSYTYVRKTNILTDDADYSPSRPEINQMAFKVSFQTQGSKKPLGTTHLIMRKLAAEMGVGTISLKARRAHRHTTTCCFRKGGWYENPLNRAHWSSRWIEANKMATDKKKRAPDHKLKRIIPFPRLKMTCSADD